MLSIDQGVTGPILGSKCDFSSVELFHDVYGRYVPGFSVLCLSSILDYLRRRPPNADHRSGQGLQLCMSFYKFSIKTSSSTGIKQESNLKEKIQNSLCMKSHSVQKENVILRQRKAILLILLFELNKFAFSLEKIVY